MTSFEIIYGISTFVIEYIDDTYHNATKNSHQQSRNIVLVKWILVNSTFLYLHSNDEDYQKVKQRNLYIDKT